MHASNPLLILILSIYNGSDSPIYIHYGGSLSVLIEEMNPNRPY